MADQSAVGALVVGDGKGGLMPLNWRWEWVARLKSSGVALWGHQHFFLPAPAPLPAILCHCSESVSVPVYILLRLPLPVVCL